MPERIEAAALARLPGIRHGFYMRRGGVSAGLYDSLNCGPGSKDEADRVARNRALVAGDLGVPADHLLTAWQVHSPTAVAVSGPWPGGSESRPRADGVVTRSRGVAVAVLTADCAPVLLADPEAGVIGAAHAGWRGAVGGIVEGTVAAMEALGARRERLRAAVGPCIGQAAYEVGPELEAEVTAIDARHARFFRRGAAGGRPHFDLPGYVLDRLAAAGVASPRATGQCTYASESDFFSYRRTTHRGEADYGRQISAIVLE